MIMMRAGSGLRIILLLGALGFCFSTTVSAQLPQATPPPPGPPRSIQIPAVAEKTLANGLRVIVIQRTNTPLVSAEVIIRNGAEVDPPHLAGLAHLTASLLTLGTRTRTATQIAEEIEALGGTQASGALWDASTASVGVMSSKITPAVEILADVVQHPTFSKEELERLRQQYIDYVNVQLGEPGSIASFAAYRVLFGDAPYGHAVGGMPDSLKHIRRSDVIRLHGELYRPNNAILIFGGDIEPGDAFRLAEKYFGDWRPAAVSTRSAARFPQPPTHRRRVLVIDKPDAAQAAVVLVHSGIKRRDPDYFRALVANSVLDGYSGRLNQEIRIKRGLSYGAGSGLEALRSGGSFLASAQTRNDAGAQVADLLLREVDRLAKESVAQDELIPRKAVLVGNFARELEQINGLVSDVGFYALLGIPLDETNRFVNNVQRISADDIRTFAASRLRASEASIVLVGNAKEFLPQLRKQFKGVEVIPIADLDLNSASLRKQRTRANRIRKK